MASHLDQIVYLNGNFLKGRDAKISIFDRGLLFADAVYEGLGILDHRVIDQDMHLARLKSSLAKLDISNPRSDAEYAELFTNLIRENDVAEGFLYLHITRGEMDRDYVYPSDISANVFAFTQTHNKPDADAAPQGMSMRSHPDLRWKRRDIKTSNLLGQVIAKTAAAQAGDYEALMIDDQGFVTEGGATSFFIVKNKCLIARPVSTDILHGITRQSMLKVAADMGFAVDLRKITLDEALSADEAFLTGASSYVQPVIRIDDQPIGDGHPGPYTLNLRAAYLAAVRGA